MSLEIDHLALELWPHGARGGLGVAVSRLVEQLADVGIRSRVFVPAGALAVGRHEQAWGEIVALPVAGTGADRIASLTELARTERTRLGPASVFVAHDHECAAAAILARRDAAQGERVVYWLHSLYDSPHPQMLPDPLRAQLRCDDSLVAAALEVADLIVTSEGVLNDARELAWPPRMHATQTALMAAAAHGSVLTVEANGCLPSSMIAPDHVPAPTPAPARPRPRVLFASRPGVHKGAGIFVAIADALANLDIEFIGLGDPIAAGIDPRANIRWLDWQTPTECWSLMRSSSCVVIPSLTEGFGLAAAEADALGVPIIYSEIAGLRSLPTSRRATPIRLMKSDRIDFYGLWGDLIGTDTSTAWATWSSARPRFAPLINRWTEQVRHVVLESPARLRAQPLSSTPTWGRRLRFALR